MKKINVKATIFLSAIVLVVVVLLLNLIEFQKAVDFTVPGIQMPKENGCPLFPLEWCVMGLCIF